MCNKVWEYTDGNGNTVFKDSDDCYFITREKMPVTYRLEAVRNDMEAAAALEAFSYGMKQMFIELRKEFDCITGQVFKNVSVELSKEEVHLIREEINDIGITFDGTLITVYFKTKPTEEIRYTLKKYGYKWDVERFVWCKTDEGGDYQKIIKIINNL